MQQFFLCTVAAALLCGAAVAEGGKPAPTRISDVPWKPDPDQEKVIYGNDDRVDLYAETDSERIGWAASTCAIIPAGSLSQGVGGDYTILASAYRALGLPAEQEPLYLIPVGG